MVYNFETDIEFFLNKDISTINIDIAVDLAKAFYIGADPSGYDEDASRIDNYLISILASAFILMNENGTSVPTSFKLDEFSIEESINDMEETKFFNLFFDWLRMFQRRNITLQYADATSLLDITAFVPNDNIADASVPTGVDT